MSCKLKRGEYYKAARPDGWDFFTGETINYREAIGKTVKVPKEYPDEKCELCHNSVLHASKSPNDCFIGAKIPCSLYVVKGMPVVTDFLTCGFKRLTVLEEVPHEKLNDIFGWNYLEAENPVQPFMIPPPTITGEHVQLLTKWASVWASVWDSVGDSVRAVWASLWDSVGTSLWASLGASVWASVRASVGDSVWASVPDSVGASFWDSLWASVRASVWASVWDSVGAYIGSLFPNIKRWKYVKHKRGVYPFQPAVDLWRQGLVPSYDDKTWCLHGGPKAQKLWEAEQ